MESILLLYNLEVSIIVDLDMSRTQTVLRTTRSRFLFVVGGLSSHLGNDTAMTATYTPEVFRITKYSCFDTILVTDSGSQFHENNERVNAHWYAQAKEE
jgi:hypothetical protein